MLSEFQKENNGLLSEDQLNAIQAMLLCQDPSQGYVTFQCSKCGEQRVIHRSCNSRLCPHCGRRLTEDWAKRIRRHLLKVPHRHVVFTLPDEIWRLLNGNRALIQIVTQQILVTVHDVFKDYLRGIKLTVGITSALHTFGTDLKFNVHFHCLVTCGGMNDTGDWIGINFFPYLSFRRSWQYHVLSALKEALPVSPETRSFISKMWDDHPNGFYVRAKDTVNNDKGLLAYIARYVRHPAIAQSRIRAFDGKVVTFACKDKEKREYLIRMDVQSFLRALAQHIPPKGYQLVKHLGLYANKSRMKCLSVISMVQKAKKQVQKKLVLYSPKCPKCHSAMEFKAITAPTDPPFHLLLSNYVGQCKLILSS